MGDNGKDLYDKALFLSASWGDNGLNHDISTKLPILNESIINEFYAKHVDSRSDPRPSIFSTIVADKLDRETRLSAQESGVTLIPARRKTRSTPMDDPPGLLWLLNHEIYYPTLGALKNVKFVVGLEPLTSDAAADIQECLFKDAKLVHLRSSALGVLFVFDSWDIAKCGLPYFHRVLLTDMHSRKGEALRLYATTLDVNIDDKQKEDIKKAGITLITARRSEFIDPEDDPVQSLWLINHTSYYKDLNYLQDIQYVVGYAPTTGDAAASIRKHLFPSAMLFQINQVHPDLCQLPDEERTKIDVKMLRMAREADAVVSIGPCMHTHFENAYRAITEKSVPHIKLIPKVGNEFTENVNFPETINQHVVLSYGEVNNNAAMAEYNEIAAAIDQVTRVLKAPGKRPLKWNILGVSSQVTEAFRAHIAGTTQNDCLNMTLNPDCSPSELATNLHQSHLCVLAQNSTEYGFVGLEAISMGLPSLVDEDSQLGCLLYENFDDYASNCLVSKEDRWHCRVKEALSSPERALKRAKNLQKAYLQSDEVKNTYAKFAALFSEELDPSDDIEATVEVNEKKFDARLEHLNEKINRLSKITPVDESTIAALKKEAEDVKEAKKRCKEGLKRKAAEVVSTDLPTLKKLCEEGGHGVFKVTKTREGSLGLSCNFLRFIDLHTFKSSCKNGRLASTLERLLISEEMKKEAYRVNILLQLQVNYDEEMFYSLEQYFIQRDKMQTARGVGMYEGKQTDEQARSGQESDKPEIDEGSGPDESGSNTNVTIQATYGGKESVSYFGKMKRFVQKLIGSSAATVTHRMSTGKGWSVRTLGQQKSGTKQRLFDNPHGLRWHDDRLLVCDTNNNRVQILDKHCKWVDEIRFDGQFPNAFRPWAVAICNEDYYITDIGNNKMIICDKCRKMKQLVNQNENNSLHDITLMTDIALVTDHKGNSVLKYEQGRLVPRCQSRVSANTQLGYPHSLVATNNSRVLVSDANNHNIKVFDSDLNFVTSYCTEGSGKGQVRNPQGIDVDARGNIYICDKLNNRIVKLKPDGKFSCNLFQGDLEYPMHIAVNGAGDAIAVSMFGDIARPVNQIRVFFHHQ